MEVNFLHHLLFKCFGPERIRIKPLHKRPATQPCDLALCIPPGCGLEILNHLITGQIAGEVRNHLPIAHGLKSLEIRRISIGQKRLGFMDQALIEHLFAALLDSGMQGFSGVMKGKYQQSVWWVCLHVLIMK